MTPRTQLIGLAIGLSTCLSLCGCGASTPASATAPQAERPAPATVADSGDAFDVLPRPIRRADDLPLRIAAVDDEPASSDDRPDDVRDRTVADDKPGLIETLRGTIQGSPVFEESGAQESLLDSLNVAQDELNRVKRQNRRALREANRQVRVGTATRAPHLVLITISDLSSGDVGCYAGHAGTPHLDAFAQQGMRFTDFYAASAETRESRWSLLTGFNVGHAPVRSESSDRDRFTVSGVRSSLAEVLWQAGYATGFVGIWDDRSSPLSCGFDVWSGWPGRTELEPYAEFMYFDGVRAELTPNLDGRHEVATIELLLEEAIATLDRRSAEGRPIFLHLAVSPKLVAAPASRTDALMRRAERAGELDSWEGGCVSRLGGTPLAAPRCTLSAGEAAAQESSGAFNGLAGGLKTSPDGLSEGNLRVPLLIRWPERISAGTVSKHACAVWDLLPTLADLAAARRRPPQLDGLSFAPELLGQPQREHNLMYWETGSDLAGQAVRKGRWKAVRAPGESKLALFDLDADPGEQDDLADAHPDIVEQFIVGRR